MDDSGALGILAIVALVAGAGVVGTGAYLYATDFAIHADVTSTDCNAPITQVLSSVSVKTRLFGIEHTVVGVPFEQCELLGEGDRVEYHIRTKHTTLYDKDGDCVYDSKKGAFCGDAVGAAPNTPGRLLD